MRRRASASLYPLHARRWWACNARRHHRRARAAAAAATADRRSSTPDAPPLAVAAGGVHTLAAVGTTHNHSADCCKAVSPSPSRPPPPPLSQLTCAQRVDAPPRTHLHGRRASRGDAVRWDPHGGACGRPRGDGEQCQRLGTPGGGGAQRGGARRGGARAGARLTPRARCVGAPRAACARIVGGGDAPRAT